MSNEKLELNHEINNMSIILLNKELPKKIIEKYEDILNRKNEIKKLIPVLKFCQVWNGYGTINCHTYPMIEGKTDIIKLVQDCYDILDYVKENNRFKDEIRTDWRIKDEILQEVNTEEIKLTMIISFAILLYGKERALFEIGKLLNKIKEF